jgi:hypothetical protein
VVKHRDTDIIRDADEARGLCKGGAKGWPQTQSFIRQRDRSKGCYRCGRQMNWFVSGLHPDGVTIDHVGSVQVSDVVGLTRSDARRLLHDRSQLALAHRRCNQHAGHGVSGTNTTTSPNDDSMAWAERSMQTEEMTT